MKKRVIKHSIIFLILIVIALVANFFLLHTFTICEKPVSVITMLIILVICYGGFVLQELLSKELLKRFLKRTAMVCLVAFAVETLIFNSKSFVPNNTEMKYETFSAITVSDSAKAELGTDTIAIQDSCELTIPLHTTDVNAVRLEFEGEDSDKFQCYISIKDGNFSEQFQRVGEKSTSATYGKCNFSFKPYEELQEIQIGFSSVTKPFTIKSIVFSGALPFQFSELRFYTLFLGLTVLCAIFTFELYRATYDRTKRSHRGIIFALTIICSLSVFAFINPDAEPIAYTKGMDVSGQDPYVQMFDATQKHQVSIAIEPSEALLAMEDPYDNSVRSAEGVSFAWDRAFYNGKYYSYYGIAPVLTFYYPYYWIHKELPSINQACLFFGVGSVIFMFGAIMAFIRKFIQKPNFLSVIACLLASLFASGIYFNIDISDLYTLPGIAGSCYLMLCLWCGVEACIRHGEKKQPILFVLSGIAFILSLASRPTRAYCCLMLAPLFLEILCSRNLHLKQKFVSATSFLVPVILGGGAIMAYNYARFGSLLDFGATYQLTVSDVNASGLHLTYLPDAILHYFLQPLPMTGSFPFLEFGTVSLSNRQSYIYSAFSCGACTVPLISAGLLVFPFLLVSRKKQRQNPLRLRNLQISVKHATYAVTLILAVLLAWIDYCVAGVILNYTCDILPLLTLLGVLVLLDAESRLSNFTWNPSISTEGTEVGICRKISGKAVCVIVLLAFATIFLVCLELLSQRDRTLEHHYPNLFYLAEELLVFWN